MGKPEPELAQTPGRSGKPVELERMRLEVGFSTPKKGLNSNTDLSIRHLRTFCYKPRCQLLRRPLLLRVPCVRDECDLNHAQWRRWSEFCVLAVVTFCLPKCCFPAGSLRTLLNRCFLRYFNTFQDHFNADKIRVLPTRNLSPTAYQTHRCRSCYPTASGLRLRPLLTEMISSSHVRNVHWRAVFLKA